MGRTVELGVEAKMNASDVADGFDDIGAAAKSMASEVDVAAAKADSAAGRMSSVADSADNVDTKAAAATGSLGALASGFELIGADKAAAGLQGAAMATDFLSGAGQGLNLILQLQAVQFVKAKVAAAAHAATTKAITVATKAYAAGQWLLNAALSANPIGIVVVAVAALIAGLVLAYNKSESFRKVVDTGMEIAGKAIGAVVGAAKKIPEWLDKGREAVGKLPEAVSSIKDTVVSYFQAMAAPIQKIVDLVQAVIDKIARIDFPDLPDLPGFGRVGNLVGGGLLGRTDGGYGGQQPVAVIDLRGAIVDPTSVVRELRRALTREGIALTGTV